jgi:DNA-binding PadR family transcriptional regulator
LWLSTRAFGAALEAGRAEDLRPKLEGITVALAQAIMTALLEDDMSGYELARSFDSALGFFWRASHQQIYQELRKLSARGVLVGRTVPQEGKPSKIVYTLTGDGRVALDQWVLEEGRYSEAKDDLMVKLHNLNQGNIAHLISELEHRRDQVMGRLYLYERIRRQHYDTPEKLPLRRQGIYLALSAAVSQGEQFLQWCDQALTLMASAQNEP